MLKKNGSIELWSGGKVIFVSEDEEKFVISDESYNKLLPGDKVVGHLIEDIFVLDEILDVKLENLVCKKSKFGFKIIERGFSNFGKGVYSNTILNVPQAEEEYKNGSIFIADFERKDGVSNLIIKDFVGHEKDKGVETETAIRKYKLESHRENEFNGSHITSEVVIVDDKFKDLPFYTIDAESTKDVDDALYSEYKDGVYDFYIAIADVSRYVKKDSFYDNIAKERTSSSYFPHGVLHMLPEDLSTKICSLNPNEEKGVLMIHCQLDDDFSLLNYDIKRTNIISKQRLSYNEVNYILENNLSMSNKKIEDSLKIFSRFSDFAEGNKIVKEKDFGYEFDFILNDNGKIDKIDIVDKESKANKLVENAMLLANKIAARVMMESTKTNSVGLYRNQPLPTIEDEKEISQPSTYDVKSSGHYSLSTDYYTHFTSPIRRYCDLVVHRILIDIINNQNLSYSEEDLVAVSEKINEKQKIIKKSARKAEDLLMADYIKRFIGKEATFKITEQIERGFVVFEENLKLEGFMLWSKLDDDVVEKIKSSEQKNIKLKIKSYDELSNRIIFDLPLSVYVKKLVGKEIEYNIVKLTDKGCVVVDPISRIDSFMSYSKMPENIKQSIIDKTRTTLNLTIKKYDDVNERIMFEAMRFEPKIEVNEQETLPNQESEEKKPKMF